MGGGRQSRDDPGTVRVTQAFLIWSEIHGIGKRDLGQFMAPLDNPLKCRSEPLRDTCSYPRNGVEPCA